MFDFAPIEGRSVAAAFDGGTITSDAGALLLGQADRAIRLSKRFAVCFTDHRMPELIEHSVGTLVMQRVMGIALGYEELNDHDELRRRSGVGGACRQARGTPRGLRAGGWEIDAESAGTEPADADPLSEDQPRRRRDRADLYTEAHKRAPEQIILDLDATDDPLHRHQEGRFFHGYYDCFCYLPLYVFCGRHLLAAKLRGADLDAAAGAVEEIARIVAQIRRRWPRVRLLLRADSGLAREELMLARNKRLVAAIAAELAEAAVESAASGKPARRFKDFRWSTLDSWSRERRVVATAEWTQGEANPRFVVTSLEPRQIGGRYLYEAIYCARGEMENRIKDASSICLPTARRRRPCAPTNCGCGLHPWATCCFVRCAASGWRTPNLPRRPAARSG